MESPQTLYRDLKDLLDEVDSDFSQIQLQVVRKFAFAFGAKVGCYEEFYRVLKEKFGDSVAARFAKQYDTKTYPGCSLMQRKGVVLQNAEIEGRKKYADFVMTRMSKEFKILKKNMKFEIGEVYDDDEERKVTFTDPVTGLSCETFVARLDIISTVLKRTRHNVIFSFNFPFATGDDEAHVMRGKLQLLLHPVDCGGVVPKEEKGNEEIIARVDGDRQLERFSKRKTKQAKIPSSKSKQHLKEAKKKGKRESKTSKKNK